MLFLLWGGIVLVLFGFFFVLFSDVVIGVMVGYFLLWLIYWLFKLLIGKEGMGYGDFKLFVVFGVWLGW